MVQTASSQAKNAPRTTNPKKSASGSSKSKPSISDRATPSKRITELADADTSRDELQRSRSERTKRRHSQVTGFDDDFDDEDGLATTPPPAKVGQGVKSTSLSVPTYASDIEVEVASWSPQVEIFQGSPTQA